MGAKPNALSELNALGKLGGSIQEAAKNKKPVAPPVASFDVKKDLASAPEVSAEDNYLKKIKNFSEDATLEGAKKMMRKYGFGRGGVGITGSVTNLEQGETAPFQDATNKSVAVMQDMIGKAARMGVKNKNEFLANYDVISKGVGSGLLDDPNYKRYVPNFKQVASEIYDQQIKKHGVMGAMKPKETKK